MSKITPHETLNSSPQKTSSNQCCSGGSSCESVTLGPPTTRYSPPATISFPVDRRGFLTMVGALGVAALDLPAMAGPFEPAEFEKMVPADKKLLPEWVKSLFARGSRTFYRDAELDKIGMPIGGICAGQVYLGGDGRLWRWDIFNQHLGTGDGGYAHPPQPMSPLAQGFAVELTAGGKPVTRLLDKTGFREITFCGEYPIGYVEYRDADVPVAVSLEAFSPFIPLNADDSALPAVVMQFTVRNMSRERVECRLGGYLQNGVGLVNGAMDGTRINHPTQNATATIIECSSAMPEKSVEHKPATVFADFEGETFGKWKVEGEAFGTGPRRGPTTPEQHLSGFQGKSLANSWTGSDAPQGKLISPEFKIERAYINFLIGGGDHPGQTCINLVVDGKVVRTQTGKNSDAMQWAGWNVKVLSGQTGHFEIIDDYSGGWGHIEVDQIEFDDRPHPSATPMDQLPDYGTMAIALLQPVPGDAPISEIDPAQLPAALFPATPPDAKRPGARPFDQELVGGITRLMTLAPGAEATATFLIAWHFPNLVMPRLPGGRHYAKRFRSAVDVVDYLAEHLTSLAEQTRLWHDTWYDSTLPYWFLDRTLLNISTLATSTCYWFADGRFYAWEGVGCCDGTCTHVWHYAQAVARLFPSLERDTRERVDFGLAFHPGDGGMGFRAEFDKSVAVDGQAGTILRAYREHQMSANADFLKRIWPRVKQAIEYLIRQDTDRDGILDGAQMNTLDAAWFGRVSWLSSMYVAALLAGEAMAREMRDEAFAASARKIADAGTRNIDAQLFNGEYYIQAPDKDHAKSVGSYNGCEIDQVMGQSWVFQVALGRVLPREHTLAALRSLWRYNFAPDVGPWRKANKPGRWYAMAGDAGLIMCTWPKGCEARVQQNFDYYFNECMTGFEYQVAGHMIWEGMVEEGLAITRAIHDRYHAARHNPWNEVECGDHYARAMASYGVFLAACGYEHHGPRGHLAFAPRLTPEKFRAPFTTAEGWGTFEQESKGGEQRATIHLKWGELRLKTLTLTLAAGAKPAGAEATVAGKKVPLKFALAQDRITITFDADLKLTAGQPLRVEIA